MKKRRIIIDGEVLVAPHFSGIGYYTLELLRGIDRQIPSYPGFTVSLLIHFRHLEKVRSYGFKNIEIIPSPLSLRITNGLKLRNKQPALDLLFGRGIYLFPNFTSWPLAASPSIPIIYDLSYELYPQFAEPNNQRFLSGQVKKAARRASFIATISQNSRREISEFYERALSDVKVYYPAVDLNHFHPRLEEEVESAKKRYGIKGNYLLFVGNIEPRKNLKHLLLAYDQLPYSTKQKTSLLLIGAKGWQDDEITATIERVRASGAVVQTPSHRVGDGDLPALYTGATAFIYPSIYEGFGIPPLEAMACGTPVICADNSSLPEAVGDAALMIDALSIDNISKQIAHLLSDRPLQQELVRKGYRQVQKFSWDKSAQQLLRDLEHL